MSTIKLNITACDNELIAVAFQGGVSYEIFRISSGNNNNVDVTISIGAGEYDKSIVLNGVNGPLTETQSTNLPAGNYSVALIGINWAGPTQFATTVNGDPFLGQLGSGAGVVWTPGVVDIEVS